MCEVSEEMKKYTTRPIDFTGCHPVIAEALKRGEAIECRVWDYKNHAPRIGMVVGFAASSKCPYSCDESGVSAWVHAEPIPLKVKRIMPPERAIPVLIAEGWMFDYHGNLVCPGEEISVSAFRYFGFPRDTPGADARFWPPCIIEEVEDDV